MIEGLLRHCTDADIEANYVDTHGASIVGFAFTELLGFKLLPRLKNIGSIRLYRPDETAVYNPYGKFHLDMNTRLDLSQDNHGGSLTTERPRRRQCLNIRGIG